MSSMCMVLLACTIVCLFFTIQFHYSLAFTKKNNVTTFVMPHAFISHSSGYSLELPMSLAGILEGTKVYI